MKVHRVYVRREPAEETLQEQTERKMANARRAAIEDEQEYLRYLNKKMTQRTAKLRRR